STGALTPLAGPAGCVAENGAGGCSVAHGLTGFRQMALSPDGSSLYVPSSGGNALVTFDRDGNGVLAWRSCMSVSGTGGQCAIQPLLTGANAAVMSPDGGNVYVSVADGMLGFGRFSDGSLALRSCVNDGGTGGCAAGRNLTGVAFSAISPDGQSLIADL